MSFKIGDLVFKKNRPQEFAIITNVHETDIFSITFIRSGAVTTVRGDDIAPQTPNTSMWLKFSQGAFDDPKDFALNFTFSKLINYTQNTLSTFRSSKTDFYPYQYIPLVKMLRNPKRRLLLCDEVGLGKTIESGIILLELKARKELQSAIISCPKSLREKWKNEMYERFGLVFEIIDTTKELLTKLENQQRLGVNQARIICTTDLLRNSIQKIIELSKKNEKYDLKSFFNFDLYICDEAHYLKNIESKRTRFIGEITEFFNTILFLTATPIMNKQDDLYSLLRMLDPTEYFDQDYFNIQMQNNAPFIRANTSLSKGVELFHVAQQLENDLVPKTRIYNSDQELFITTDKQLVSEKFKNNSAYKNLISLLKENDNTSKNRVKVQNLLNGFNVLGSILTRNRRKDVLADKHYTKRTPIDRFFRLSSEEKKIWKECDTLLCEHYDSLDSNNFGYITKSQQLASSLHAFNENDNNFSSSNYSSNIKDSKFAELLELVNERSEKMVIFSRYLNTIKYLSGKFAENGISALTFTGATKNRHEVIEKFKNDSVDLLILSEAGNEGIDLQFCSTLINYDLPWNPMRIEQRIGRIDRIGQEAERIVIINFVQADSVEERVYELLRDKIRVFQESIGDLEAILSDNGFTDKSLEQLIHDVSYKKFYNKLNTLEEEEKIRAIEKAKYQSWIHLNEVDSGLSSALVNDAFFKEEVERIRTEKRYITPLELEKFIKMYFKQRLNHCELRELNNSIFKIEVPSNDRGIVLQIIKEDLGDQIDNDNELRNLLREFEISYEKNELIIFFDWNKSFFNKNYQHINAVHPITQAAISYFNSKNRELKNKSYMLEIEKDLIPDLNKEELEIIDRDGGVILLSYNVNITDEQPFIGKAEQKKQHMLALPIIFDKTNCYNFLLKDSDFDFHEEFGFKLYYSLINSGVPFELEDFDPSELKPSIEQLERVILYDLKNKFEEQAKNDIVRKYETYLMNLTDNIGSVLKPGE